MASTPTEHTFPGFAPRVDTVFRASLLQIPLFGDENLLTQGADIHPTVAAQLVVAGRLWSDAERQIKLFREAIDLPAGGAIQSKFTVLEKGALLSVRVSVDTAGIARGDVWARLVLSKGLTGGLTFPATLVQGYVTNVQDVAWPGSPIESLHDSKGAIREITWTAVGIDRMQATVPASRRWRVITGTVAVTTDGTAGTRTITLTVTTGGGLPLYLSESAPGQGPGVALTYTIAPGMVPPAAAGVFAQLLPFSGDLELLAGEIIEVRVRNLLGVDTILGNRLIVREWFAP